MTSSEAATEPCPGPMSDTLPSVRMPRPPSIPTILPPPLPSSQFERDALRLLNRIAFRLLTLNLIFWLLAGLAVAQSCGR